MWRKATYSNSQGACVEVGAGTGEGMVGVRDTTQHGDLGRTVIQVSVRAWSEFMASLK
jgi:hypothetical protein